jgi:hypothetical protein
MPAGIISGSGGNPMCMLESTDSTLITIITGFIALKIDQTSEIKIHDETHYEPCTMMHHDGPLFRRVSRIDKNNTKQIPVL